jgi:hypothetical protein
VGAPTWAELSADPSCRAITDLGPAMMPALTWLSPRPRRRGRPKLEYDRRTRIIARGTAWLADVCGWSNAKIAREITSPWLATLDHEGETASLRRKARSYVSAGRTVLAEEGVLPWVCWDEDEDGRGLPEGDLPAGWWDDEWFLAHVDLWGIHADAEADASSR